jgi:hypothetical protein
MTFEMSKPTAQKADAEKAKKLSAQLQESIEILEGQISVAVNWGFNESDTAQASLAEMEKDKIGLEVIKERVLALEALETSSKEKLAAVRKKVEAADAWLEWAENEKDLTTIKLRRAINEARKELAEAEAAAPEAEREAI